MAGRGLRAAAWALLLLLRPAAPLARQLRRLVLVGRHSVKNPYPPAGAALQPGVANSPLALYTSRPLPAFAAEPGQLTARGRELMGHLGAYFREAYAGLLQGVPCEALAMYADPASDRDVHSAEAFLHGLAGPAGCAGGAVNRGASARRLQRVFRDQPDAADVARGCVPPTVEELGALLGAGGAGGGRGVEASWLRVYKRQLSVVQELTQCCSQDACPAGAGGLCTVFGLPTALEPNVTWRAIGGPLGVASAFAEIFQMQLCEGLEAAWGTAEEEVVDLLSLLDVPFNEAGANEVTSRNLGSELLHELLRALSPAPGAAAPALAAYFGHDTNLQFLRRMLKLNWLSEGWWPNLAEPGSLLVFELYEEPGGSESVRLLKVAATPRQQRRAEPLTTEAPPSVVPLWIPGCRGLFCPMSQFAALAGAAIRRECVEEAAEGGSAGAEFRHPEDSAPLRGMQAAAAGLASASALAEPLGTVHAESAPAGPGAPPAAAAGRAPGEVRAEQAGGALPGGASAAPPRGPAAAALEGAAEAPSARGPTAPAAAQAAPETPLEPQRDGGGGGGFSLVLVLAVAGFFGWRYWKQQAASRGYESIGGTGGRSRGTTASERIIGSRSAGAAMPGFTL